MRNNGELSISPTSRYEMELCLKRVQQSCFKRIASRYRSMGYRTVSNNRKCVAGIILHHCISRFRGKAPQPSSTQVRHYGGYHSVRSITNDYGSRWSSTRKRAIQWIQPRGDSIGTAVEYACAAIKTDPAQPHSTSNARRQSRSLRLRNLADAYVVLHFARQQDSQYPAIPGPLRML